MLHCQYGIKCYRENLQHIIHYNHDEINKKRFDKIIIIQLNDFEFHGIQ
jgi:hypothetical protein